MSDRSPHLTSKKRSHPDNDDPPGRSKTPENTTPPPEQQRSTKETPAKPRSAHSASFWDGGLTQKRIALLEDLGYAIPEVETDTFLNIFFPPLKAGISVDSIRASLERDGTIKANKQPTADRKVPKSSGKTEGSGTGEKRWAAIPKDPKSSKEGENTVFQPFESIFNEVVEQALQSTVGLEQTFALRLLPNTAPESERESLTRPDGCFILKKIEDSSGNPNNIKYRWYDIALTCEFKKHDNEAQQDANVTKIVYSMQHTMTLDPCKRFTFGITIENASVRMWFCSRAIMAVSKPFNFNEEPDLLIHVFLSLAFATKVELGWDPTIRVEPNAKTRVYEIKVNEQWYQVVDVLSDFGADAIIGRATRVFRVKLKGSNQFYVLKDVWVEDDRPLEHEIYDMILNDVKRTFNEEKMNQVASHLLTPVNNWLVTFDDHVDHTRDVMMRGRSVSLANSFRLKAQDYGNKDAVKAVAPMKSGDWEVREELNVHLGSRIAPKEQKKPLRHRKHYRVVFQEVAKPIWTLTSLSDVFLVLRDAAVALKYIHRSGWVHRDISAGNIYFFQVHESEVRGIIGDLEYAKKVTQDGSHQMRTGTPDFMAVEVLLGGYQFRSEDRSVEDNAEDLESFALGNDLPDLVLNRPFVQNEGHDIESLWWLANYILFFNCQVGVEQTPSQQKLRMEYTILIFPSTAVANGRIEFLRDPDDYAKGTSWFPDSFLKLRVALNKLRDLLVGSYIRFERSLPKIDQGAFAKLQDSAVNAFEGCRLIARDITITSYKTSGRPLPPDPAQAEPPSTDANKVQRILEDLPRPPKKRLGLRQT